MRQPDRLLLDLREQIQAILAGAFDGHILNSFIRLCHELSKQHLSVKLNNRTLNTKLLGLELSDLAFDCIADLFRRDERNNLVFIQKYFQGFDIATLSDHALLAHLRRLVFSTVNDGLFRTYHTQDPVLGKIIRNTKIAIHSLKNFKEIERCGEICIVPSFCESLEHLPTLDRDDIDQAFTCVANGSENVPELLTILSSYLHSQDSKSRIVPLMIFALSIRSLYTRHLEIDQQATTALPLLLTDDLENIINRTCDKIKQDVSSRYRKKKNNNPKVINAYFDVVREYMHNRMMDGQMDETTLYECLQKHLGSLSRDEYRKTHKSKLEYCFHLTWEEAVGSLQREGFLGDTRKLR